MASGSKLGTVGGGSSPRRSPSRGRKIAGTTSWRWLQLTDVTIFVNGTSVGVLGYATRGTPLLFDAKHPIQIGRASRSEGWFTGAIDEVAIYDHLLTVDQVMAHYVAGTRSPVTTAWPGGPQGRGSVGWASVRSRQARGYRLCADEPSEEGE